MFYRKNVGRWERWGRLLGGGLIGAYALNQIGLTPLGWMLAGTGVVLVLTGLVGFCPACAALGRGSLKDDQ